MSLKQAINNLSEVHVLENNLRIMLQKHNINSQWVMYEGGSVAVSRHAFDTTHDLIDMCGWLISLGKGVYTVTPSCYIMEHDVCCSLPGCYTTASELQNVFIIDVCKPSLTKTAMLGLAIIAHGRLAADAIKQEVVSIS